MTELEREFYTNHIKARLTDWRFKHSVNVSVEAVRLAKKYGGDVHKAELAGLLHDVMKDAGNEAQLFIIQRYSVETNEVERHEPKLWHAIAGAAYVQHELSIDDEDIVNAVRYHTTARAGMSLLEKIVYIADYTSAERDYDGVDKMRKASNISLETAMGEALRFSIKEQLKKHGLIEPHTCAAYNEVILAKE